MKAKQILEAYKRLKGIKEEKCCDSETCECGNDNASEELDDAEVKEINDSEEEDTLEVKEPVTVQEDEDEDDSLDDARLFQVVMNKLELKPNTVRLEAYPQIINAMASLINDLPAGPQKLKLIMKAFRKENKI